MAVAGTVEGDIPNVISVDVEDWYQSCVDCDAPISGRCYESTRACLDAMDNAGVKGTFFVQGMVAEQRPEVVRAIAAAGHDVQTHGHSHRPVNRLGPEGFRQDMLRAKGLIEDITGRQVEGFRAPDFTIDADSFWAFEVMAEMGFTFDSSIFPMRTRRYGISGYEPGYSVIKNRDGSVMEELPVTVVKRGAVSLPAGGGGYFRLWPKAALTALFNATRADGRPFVIYCHPYEFNTREWEDMPKGYSWAFRLHQSIGRAGFPDKVRHMLGLGRFGTMKEALVYCRDNTTPGQPEGR